MFNLPIINDAHIGDIEFHVTMAVADALLKTGALRLVMTFSLLFGNDKFSYADC